MPKRYLRYGCPSLPGDVATARISNGVLPMSTLHGLR
jgi:hypothetical protein